MVETTGEEKDLRVFNAAKRFAEEILFPLMSEYQAYQRQSDFGAMVLGNSLDLNEDIRNIERYNGLKAMADVCLNLAIAIKSTVFLHNNKEEKAMIDSIIENLEKVKWLFYNHKEKFFEIQYTSHGMIEVIDRRYFENVKKIIQACYVNTEILMTRNKLLFSDRTNEYLSDKELIDEIKREYAGD